MLDSPPPSYSFHGSNSSHSKDNGSGGRTYHIPNYATSYANERSSLISVTFDEDKKTSKAIIGVVIVFLLFAAIPLALTFASKPPPPIEVQRVSSPNLSPQMQALRTQDWLFDPKVMDKQAEKSREAVKIDKAAYPAPEAELSSGGNREDPHGSHRAATPYYWDEPTPNQHCYAFGKREYTARLRNVPFYANRSLACKNTEIKIHGFTIKHPDACKTEWPLGKIIGHWIVNYKEDDCLAKWGEFVDKGCVSKVPKQRRFRSRLWDIKAGEDWMLICKTAPAVIRGISSASPTDCDDQGLWGIYGVWDLEDDTC